MFLLMQLVGGAFAVAVVAVLYPTVAAVADAVVVPHDSPGGEAAPTPPSPRKTR
jgi:arsenate reductase